ncbi:Imm26 family immunity protein [Peribacillus sp. B2I2]|uniref:Imm26 family immunity protein n=1 Tax=Peribacillus sp. B2I2 TaxID=3156468 RepID=UPI003515AAA7
MEYLIIIKSGKNILKLQKGSLDKLKVKKKRVKMGNVYAIPLPDKKYAFGKVYKDACIGIYKEIGNTMEELPKKEEFDFIVGVYQDLLKSGKWPLVDYREFPSEEEAWPPEMSVYDTIAGTYSIYYKGEISPSTEKKCRDLEQAAVWEEEHIIDRIMGDDKWNCD